VFSDAALFAEVASKAAFWQQDSYYGVDLTRLLQPAVADYFAQARARRAAAPARGGLSRAAPAAQPQTAALARRPACRRHLRLPPGALRGADIGLG